MTRARFGWLVSGGLAAAVAGPVHATFHFMQIERVIGGVGGDAGAQAIQLRMRANLQNLVSGGKLWAHDAAGLNPVLLIDFTSNVPDGSAGARVLIASPGFPAVTSPAAAPDFVLTNVIPESSLPAGTITFENNSGLAIYWRLSWGGDAYTGSTTGSITNDPDGEFGPPWPDPLPSGGEAALAFQGPFNAPSTSNADDYDLTTGAAVFTNNAGASFTVVAPCPWDCINGDGEIGIDEFLAVLGSWGQTGVPCDVDGGGVGITDFLKVLGLWGACP